MKLNMKNELEKNIYKVIISFEEYGSANMTAEEEQELINDYTPFFNLRDIEFSAKMTKDENNKITIVEEDETEGEGESIVGDLISISIIDRQVYLNEDFEIHYKVSVNDIVDNELGEILNTKHLVAQAKAELFRKKIINKVRIILEKIREKRTGFEREEIEVL